MKIIMIKTISTPFSFKILGIPLQLFASEITHAYGKEETKIYEKG